MPRTEPTTYEILLAIRASDPDGWATAPTEEDYNQFETWVVKTYGRQMWETYNSNWDERSTE